MISLLWRWLFFLVLAVLLVPSSGAAPWTVVLVRSESGGAYQEASDAFLLELERAGVARGEVLQLTAAELAAAGQLSPRMFVTLGVEAAKVLAGQAVSAPVLCTLLPRMSFERVMHDSGRNLSAQFSALYLTQPLARQFDLIRLALPRVRRVGVLLAGESLALEAELRETAQSRGLRLVSVYPKPQEPVFRGLKKILEEADLLLALPEPQIYNSNTIQNILLTSFRAQVPMMAFSPAYVRAGAALALYSTPTQIGQQAGVLARSVLQGRPLGPPQYPRDFTLGVNEHVARTLDLALDSEALADKLRRLERAP